MKTAEIAQRYLDYFEKNGHVIVPSASLVTDDPALLFTVAGMVPFIPYLSGNVPPPYARAADVQKCIRTNDIEEVGKTPRHGTFFQMLGNWSFGDYFKEGAITLRVGAPDESPRPTAASASTRRTSGSPSTRRTTRRSSCGSASRAFPRSASSGSARTPTTGAPGFPGPAGPCSEIFFDRGPAYGIDGGPATDDDRYVEIWNLVFMQYAIDDVRSKYDFRHRRRAAEQEHRHRHGPRARRVHQAGRRQHVRDRPGAAGARQGGRALGQALRRRPRGRRAVPHRRRPRPLVAHAALGRRHALERGPRLHPPPPHAPRHPLDAPARRRRRRRSPSCSPRRATR